MSNRAKNTRSTCLMNSDECSSSSLQFIKCSDLKNYDLYFVAQQTTGDLNFVSQMEHLVEIHSTLTKWSMDVNFVMLLY